MSRGANGRRFHTVGSFIERETSLSDWLWYLYTLGRWIGGYIQSIDANRNTKDEIGIKDCQQTFACTAAYFVTDLQQLDTATSSQCVDICGSLQRASCAWWSPRLPVVMTSQPVPATWSLLSSTWKSSVLSCCRWKASWHAWLATRSFSEPASRNCARRDAATARIYLVCQGPT